MELETYFSVPEQTRLLLLSILLGLPLGVCLDVLRTMRVLVRHGRLAAAVEDVAFLLVWAAGLVCFASVFARGELRGYYALGSLMGLLLYRCTIGCVTVPLLRRILTGIFSAAAKVGRPLFHGVVRIGRRIFGKFGYFAKVFGKSAKIFRLPLIAARKMLYNKGAIQKSHGRRRQYGGKRNNRRKKASLDL